MIRQTGSQEREMSHPQFRTNVKPATTTTARWGDQVLDHHPHFAEVALALLPASLILATATALLVALI
jgi:hypothetical protein